MDGEIELLPNFIWLTLGQLKYLMTLDNVVNMDSRTVISGIPFGSYSNPATEMISHLAQSNKDSTVRKSIMKSLRNVGRRRLPVSIEHLSQLSHIKAVHDLWTKEISLFDLNEWQITADAIERHRTKSTSK